jgi:hypothetical protein
MLIIKEFINGHPTVIVVDIVTETGSINDGQLYFKVLFLEFCFLLEYIHVTPFYHYLFYLLW